jgi:hypothetical protein
MKTDKIQLFVDYFWLWHSFLLDQFLNDHITNKAKFSYATVAMNQQRVLNFIKHKNIRN